MIEESVQSLWWEEIHGPRSVRAEIYGALCGAKPVILTGKAIPWLKFLRSLISTDIQNAFEIYTVIIDAEEEDPGRYLLGRFGKEFANSYREHSDPPLPKYLKNIKALENSLICITGIGDDCFKSWERFLKDFKTTKPEEGLFLINTSVPFNEIMKSTRITVIDIASKITFHDVLLFSMLLASKLDIDEIWKQYTAWMVSLLFGNNVELLADIVTNEMPRHSTNDYHNIIKSRLADGNLLPDKANFDKSLWTAQIQILFPIIENLRVSIIKQNFEKMKNALQTKDEYYFGNRIVNPFDAELGLLAQLSYLFPDKMRQNIYFLRDCRNSLAHIEYCNVSDIDSIISLNSMLVR